MKKFAGTALCHIARLVLWPWILVRERLQDRPKFPRFTNSHHIKDDAMNLIHLALIANPFLVTLANSLLISAMSTTLPSTEKSGILELHKCGLPIFDTTEKPPPPVYVLLSGFPDSPTTFDSFCKPFEKTHHIVKIAFPDMGSDELKSFWGYSHSEIEHALIDVLKEYKHKYNCDTILLHGFDWGAIIALMILQDYPDVVTKAVIQDVGLVKISELPVYDAVVIASYQSFLALAFLISRVFFNDRIAALILGPFKYFFPWFLLMPLPSNEDLLSSVGPHLGYPYLRWMWSYVSTGHGIMPEFQPKVPQFFAYGNAKRVHFHTVGYTSALEACPNCSYKAYEGASHWFHQSHEEEFRQDVLDFFKEETTNSK